jgi:hypothetical protein
MVLTVAGSCKKDKGSAEAEDSKSAAPSARKQKAGRLRLGGAELRVAGGGVRKAFSRGERVMCWFNAAGFAAPKGKLQLVSHLFLEREDGTVIMHKGPNTVIDAPIPPGRSRRTIRGAVRLDLSHAAATGPHRLRIRLVEAATQRRGELAVRFDIRGKRYAPAHKLVFNHLRMPPDEDLRAGGPVFVDLNLAGFSFADTKPKAAPGRPRWKVDLDFEAAIKTDDGRVVDRQKGSLVESILPFKPTFLPLEPILMLPADIARGAYVLDLKICDRIGKQCNRATPRFKVLPAGFGVYGLRIHGGGGVPKKRFYRGERLVARFYVWGQQKPAAVEGDVALEGPRGGVYLVRKRAFRFGRKTGAGKDGGENEDDRKNTDGDRKARPKPDTEPKSQAENRETQMRRYAIPMRIPEFAPRGRFKLHLRVRDKTANRQASRKIAFAVEGKKIPPLPSFQLTQLELKKALPKGKRGVGRYSAKQRRIINLLHEGQEIEIRAVVGGIKLRFRRNTYKVDLTMNVYLRDRRGKLIKAWKDVTQFTQRLSFPPLRLRLETEWRVPDGVRGIHLLQVEVVNRDTQQVSMRQRKVRIKPM